MPEASADLYFDTVTLSNFALASRLDLVRDRYGARAQVTEQVLDEALDGIVAGYRLQEIEEAVLQGRFGLAKAMTPAERAVYRELVRILSPGEASCVTLAQERGGIVASDDRAARGCCVDRGVAVTGTIGILKACLLEGVVSPAEADGVLQDMIDAGFYSPVRRITSLV